MNVSFAELWQHMGWFGRGIAVTLWLIAIVAVTAAVRRILEHRKARTSTR